MKKEAEVNADSDKKAKEEAEKINMADSLIFQTEKQLKEYGEKIPADKKEAIEKALEELKAAHTAKDLPRMDAALEAMNTTWAAASEDIYKATQDANTPPTTDGQAAPENGKANTENVEDATFEEVK